MCGICGYLRRDHIPKDIFRRMNDSMHHRGPDDSGMWTYESHDRCIGLGHRRLSIMDLSERGHQPMVSEDGSKVIAFNGEIYNFKEIRKELTELGYSFKSDCDTEVVLYSYSQWQEKCFQRFNGMFAIAIYDKSEDSLILARDRLGKKPLYYYYDGSDLVFGSEMKPIMLSPGFCREIDYQSLGKFFCNKYIEAPHTILKNVFKLEPGTILRYKNNELKKEKYWDIISIFNTRTSRPMTDSLEEAKHQYRDLLTESIKMRMVADVPVGLFLSRGFDSACIAAIAQSVSDRPIDTYTIGFYDKKRDEAPQSREIAKYLGTNHHEYYVGEEECKKMLEGFVRYYDEPFSDSSQIPTMLVNEIASKEITVALSGDGGDEPFCGYSMYDLEWLAQKIDILGDIEAKMPWNNILMSAAGPEFRAFVNNRGENSATKSQFFTDVRTELAEKLLGCKIDEPRYPVEKTINTKNWQEKRMLVDMVTYLPDECLQKMDRASMRSSLEVRCPLLDHRIIEWSMDLHHNLKYHNFEKKYITKQLVYDYLPEKLMKGPKNGFGVPMHKWLRTFLKKDIMELSGEDFIKKQGIFDYGFLKGLIEMQEKSDKVMYSSVLWSFYVFQRWYEEYM